MQGTQIVQPEAATTNDHIPDEFTLESLQSALTEQEIALLNEGDDPLFPPEEAQDTLAAEQADAIAAQQIADNAHTVAETEQATEQPQTFEFPDVSAIDQALKEAEKKLNQIEEQYNDGDLTDSEYMAQQRPIIEAQARAQVQMEMAQEQINRINVNRRSAFANELEAFKAQNAVLWNEEHLNGWDQALRAVTGNAQYATRPFKVQIELARDIYVANHFAMTEKEIEGLAARKPKPEAATERKGPRHDDRDEPVTTLAGMNGDSGSLMDDGEFAAVDRAMEQDPLKGEAMLKSFSAAKLQRYLETAQ